MSHYRFVATAQIPPSVTPLKVIVSGSSGVLGKAICADLEKLGYKVLKLTRGQPRDASEVRWNPESGATPFDDQTLARMEGMQAAVHLSGANVASKRWTIAYKKEIADSRIGSTRRLAEALSKLSRPPQTMVSASAVGFYGDRGDEILDENSAAGSGFFPDLCVEWEEACAPAVGAGIRVVHPRFGVVLSREGGALAQMKTLFKLGLGGELGNGKQWMSWVSEVDAAGAVAFAIQNDLLSGACNTCAPEPVTNAEFTRRLADAVHRPAFMTAPAFALRLAFGEMADEALLSSSRAVPKKLQAHGFRFRYPRLDDALRLAIG